MEKSNKKAAVFLDRDGTINIDYGYVYQKERLKFIDGAVEGLELLQRAGYLLIVVTNQSGVARGIYTLEQMNEFNQYMVEQLRNKGIKIEKIYSCPHLKNCECRKPKLKLFYQAAQEYNIDFSKSYVIGDKIRDLSLCEKEPVTGYLIGNEKVESDRIIHCDNLLTAAKNIIYKK